MPIKNLKHGRRTILIRFYHYRCEAKIFFFCKKKKKILLESKGQILFYIFFCITLE